MTTLKLDKTLACLVSAAAIASISFAPQIEASPVFPPAHISPAAEFSAPADPTIGETTGSAVSWYRPEGSSAPVLRATEVQASSHAPVTEAWYRATN